jgi:hypothetical protein
MASSTSGTDPDRDFSPANPRRLSCAASGSSTLPETTGVLRAAFNPRWLGSTAYEA